MTAIVFLWSGSYAQGCIEGFVIMKSGYQTSSLALVGFSKKQDDGAILEKSGFDDFGFFQFSCTSANFPHYRIVLLQDSSNALKNDQLASECSTPIFLLANKKDLDLSLDSCLSTDMVFNESAFREWKRFVSFQNRASHSNGDSSIRTNTRNFIKDSLEILMVKLFGTRTLNDKNLLAADLNENLSYYEDLLKELKASQIEPSYYHFLEAKVLQAKNDRLLSKLKFSSWLNIVLFITLVVALVFISVTIVKTRKDPDSLLSIQEQKIKELIIAGKSNKEIGAELFISISTVKTHVSNIYQKLGVRSRKDLINI